MEIPTVKVAFGNQHIKEFITGDILVVGGSIADGSSIDQPMTVQLIHGCHDTVKSSIATAAVGCRGKALY